MHILNSEAENTCCQIEDATLYVQLKIWPRHTYMSITYVARERRSVFKRGTCVSTFPAPPNATVSHKRPFDPAGLLRLALRAKPPYHRLKILEASRRVTAGHRHTMQPRKVTHRTKHSKKQSCILVFFSLVNNKNKYIFLNNIWFCIRYFLYVKMYLRPYETFRDLYFSELFHKVLYHIIGT